nr:hypothetical protein [uncultured Vibrio sp.]
MTLASSKRIVFINIDKPPEKVANYIENYTDNLITRLGLHQSSYWVIEIDSDQFDSENIIQTASCIVIGGLWPLTLDQRCKALLSSLMHKLVKRRVPLLVFGTAEPILLEVTGCESEPYTGLLDLSEIQRFNQQDLMAFPTSQRWVWRVSDSQEKAATIFSEFGKVITPSTIPVISQSPLEFGIYPHELCAVAKQLQLPIQLLDSVGAAAKVKRMLCSFDHTGIPSNRRANQRLNSWCVLS